jgi:hypothetical protein
MVLQEHGREFQVVVFRRGMEGRYAVHVGQIDLGALFDKLLGECGISIPGGLVDFEEAKVVAFPVDAGLASGKYGPEGYQRNSDC